MGFSTEDDFIRDSGKISGDPIPDLISPNGWMRDQRFCRIKQVINYILTQYSR